MPAPGAAYVVIDVETTGLIPGEDHVYEIAMSAFDDEGIELARFESLICPAMAKLSKRLSPVAAAPTFEAIAGTVCDWLRIAPVVGHNVTFDLAMIDGELARFGAGLPEVPYIDTLALAEQVDLGSSDLRLSTLIPHLGITGADFHTAMADVWAANQLLIRLRAALSGTAGLVPLPTPATFHGRSRGPWPDLPGRAAPLPRDPATFPAAVRRPDKHEPGLHGTIVTIATADFTVPPDLQRQIDERTIEVARQGVAAIVPGAQLPERIAALLGPIGSTDFEEALGHEAVAYGG
jgi:DNA polymerase III epsilon subunit-like protein